MSRKYKKRKNGTTFRNLQWEQGLDYWMARNGYGARTWGQYPSVDWSDKWKPEATAFYKKNSGKVRVCWYYGPNGKYAYENVAPNTLVWDVFPAEDPQSRIKRRTASSTHDHVSYFRSASEAKRFLADARPGEAEYDPAHSRWNPKHRKLLVKRKAYRTKKGRRVPAKSFRIADRGRPGRGPYTLPKIKKGGLGGPGYTSKPQAVRHAILRKVVKSKGYRTALGRIMLLRRYGKRTMSKGVLKLLARDRRWLVKTFGGEGSFKKRKSRRRNPTHTAFVPHHGPGKIIARRPKNMVDVKLKNGRTVRVSARSLRRSR